MRGISARRDETMSEMFIPKDPWDTLAKEIICPYCKIGYADCEKDCSIHRNIKAALEDAQK